MGVGKRTLWRWIATGRPAKRHSSSSRRFVLTPELRDAYLRRGGNVAAVWREARERGLEVPPLRTLQAAFGRELSPAERASARHGEAGRARRQAQSRLAPATSGQPDPAEVTRLPERARVARERGTRREEALRAAARTDLLLPTAGPPRAKR